MLASEDWAGGDQEKDLSSWAANASPVSEGVSSSGWVGGGVFIQRGGRECLHPARWEGESSSGHMELARQNQGRGAGRNGVTWLGGWKTEGRLVAALIAGVRTRSPHQGRKAHLGPAPA